jgi:hypothetical protein
MERWQQIESLFQQALERDPAERNAWLREACHDDSDLQREVSSLLANHQAATDSQPWAAAAAAKLIDGPLSLEPGQCLGPYEILAPIGKGGMGEVYKARDTRLKRDVAIKICAAQFSERFEREARVIASLNHPNICQLHDVGPNYLVMELVEGPTLADRIRKGALPFNEALTISRQIAEALEAAHEKGRVHRHLKPANVKITPDGMELGALGVVVNALVLWTTRYMDKAIAHLRSEGVAVKPEDVARLSPLASKYFNVLGRYHFTVTDDAVRRGELRSLRNPNAFEQEILIA